jgi:hypothetical protein
VTPAHALRAAAASDTSAAGAMIARDLNLSGKENTMDATPDRPATTTGIMAASLRDRVLAELSSAIDDLAASTEDDIGIVTPVVADLSQSLLALDQVAQANAAPPPAPPPLDFEQLCAVAWNASQEAGSSAGQGDRIVAAMRAAVLS